MITRVKSSGRRIGGIAKTLCHRVSMKVSGFDPVDWILKGVRRDGLHAHQSERFILLGNFMLLLRIHPDRVFRWFMEMFVDGCDWLMVPNLYGMCQLGDVVHGSTQPYLLDSEQILAMSDFSEGDWCGAWDALYWNFLDENRSLLANQKCMSDSLNRLQKMGAVKLRRYQQLARSIRFRLQSGRAWQQTEHLSY